MAEPRLLSAENRRGLNPGLTEPDPYENRSIPALGVQTDAPAATALATPDHVLNMQDRRLEPIQQHAELVQKLALPHRVDITFALAADGRNLRAGTSLPNAGNAQLASFVAPDWSDEKPNVISWLDFRREVQKLDRNTWVFRGQAAPWSLRTCFHRRGRYDLIRYGFDDIRAMQSIFVAATNQWLQTADPVQHGTGAASTARVQ